MEGYCIKCKSRKEIVDAVEHVLRNGRRAVKGKCPDCGSVMVKIVGTVRGGGGPADPSSSTEAAER